MSTILIAEDELSIATLLRDILEEEGYRVVIARHGQEALELLAATRPALVLTDVMMPFLDGVGLCRAMQASPHYRDIPIIMMSAVVDQPQADGCNAIGFIKKPFDLESVIATVGRVLGRADTA